MSLDLERIIRFSVVAEEQSFTRAARRLRVDQPWLSRQIQQLEAQLGFALLIRSTRRVELTDEGRIFLAQAHELAEVAERTRALARSISRERTQSIKIGISPSTFWVNARHRLMETYRMQNPEANIDVTGGQTPALIEALGRRDLDLVIGAFVAQEQFDRLPLHKGAPGMLIPKEHPLLLQPVIRMRDLAGCALATTIREINPAGFDRLYQPFFDVGATARPVMEGRMAMIHYARIERLLVLAVADEDRGLTEGSDLVYREIEDAPKISWAWVYRRPGDARPLVRRFWAAAKQTASADQ